MNNIPQRFYGHEWEVKTFCVSCQHLISRDQRNVVKIEQAGINEVTVVTLCEKCKEKMLKAVNLFTDEKGKKNGK